MLLCWSRLLKDISKCNKTYIKECKSLIMVINTRKDLWKLIIVLIIFNIIVLVLYRFKEIKLVNNILFVLIIFVGAYFISKIITIYVDKTIKVRRGLEKTPELFNRLIIIIIFIIALVIILNYFKIQVTPILAGLGIAGLAIALALQSTLSNFFAGLQILSSEPIKIGDYVEIGDLEGYVEDIGWRAVRIKTLPNNMIIIPNSKLVESTIINYSMPIKEMSALVDVGVDYSSDLRKVEKITLDVAKKIQKTVPGAVEQFEPFIRYHTFADSNINFTVILRVKDYVSKYLIKHEFIKALKERYDKEGIEISWPIRKIVDMRKMKKRWCYNKIDIGHLNQEIIEIECFAG